MPGGSKKSMHEVAISEFKARCLCLLNKSTRPRLPPRDPTRQSRCRRHSSIDRFRERDWIGSMSDSLESQATYFRGHRNPRNRGSETMRLLLDTHSGFGAWRSPSVSHGGSSMN